MKAAVRSKYGSPDVIDIKEIPAPVPAANEVLVKVIAATVNRTDCGILTGKPYVIRLFSGITKPRLQSTGTDFAGIISATGKNVSNFEKGDRVWGFNDNGLGSHAQFITINADGPITTIPVDVNFEQAAASAEGAHYALNFINKVKLQVTDQVLVNGATGAIGSAAVQLLKHFGVKVTAVCETRNIELVRSLGADRIVDYLKEDFTTDGTRYRFVFDAVGKSTFGKCKQVLQPGGAYLSTELGPGGENIYLPFTTMWSNKKVIFPFPSDIKRSLRLIRKLLETKEFMPVIDRTYPLEEIREAFRYVASGKKTGNVVIKMGD